MPDSNVITLRLDSQLKKKLDKLASATQRSRSFIAAEAIREFVELNEWQIEDTKRAVQEADAGDFLTEEELNRRVRKLTRRAG
jgi:RHH-type transcriptional regulator, rel operon repressor / antitoxin RelB